MAKHPIEDTHQLATLIRSIQELLRRSWDVSLTHTLREGNASADFPARLSASQLRSIVILEAPPPGLGILLDGDAQRVPHLRARG